MKTKRRIEIFSAGCPVCEETVEEIRSVSCPSCDITVLDMKDGNIAERAKKLGIRSVPAVIIDGKLSACGCGCGVDVEKLKKEELGQPLA